MYRIALIALVILLTTPLSNASDDSPWKLFNFSKTTPDKVVMLFGPPSIIKTEEKYSDWIKNQAQGCGQIHIYVMSYSIWTGDLNILKGPLGKASEVEVVIDDGKLCDVVWIYDNNQHDPAFRQWMGHKGLTRIG